MSDNEIKVYYNTGLVIVRDTIDSDILKLSTNMRPADIAEIWKSNHRTPKEALLNGYKESLLCLTMERRGNPIGMAGICPRTILGNTASIWLLSSLELDKVQHTFIKRSKWFINLMLEYYPVLENWVDVNNLKAIKWLSFCGAIMKKPQPYGLEKALFRHFYFIREDIMKEYRKGNFVHV
jgi:hypothetical protein